MIRLVELEIIEFRGIRHLIIQMAGESLLVHGPNGTGKSGVVDAIDFALTGSVARLTGEGTAGVSVKVHGPHVLQRSNPDAARVSLRFRTQGGTEATLSRTVRRPNEYELTPDTEEFRAAVNEAGEHTELILTRRDILKFILAKPGERSQAVQTLLKLESLESLRQTLRTAKTQLTKEKNSADGRVAAAAPDLAALLGGGTTARADVTAAANKRRMLLNLPVLTEANLTSGRDWIALDDGVSRETSGINRVGAVRIASELQATAISVTARTAELVGELNAAVAELGDLTAAQHALAQRTLLVAALGQVSGSRCPVCDLDWDSEEALRTHLTGKIAASAHAGAVQSRISTASSQLGVQLETLQRKILTAAESAATLLVGTAHTETMRTWAAELTQTRQRLAQDSAATIADARTHGEAAATLTSTTTQTSTAVEALAAAADALPDQSELQAASGWLAHAQERWTRLAHAKATQRDADEHARIADALYEKYCAAMDSALDELYRSIETQFSAHYQQMNAGDEDTFRAELAPAAGKLDLAVGFYDLGLFPPGAYHSEGHQDGMGLALYLALLDHMLGEELSFVVLDDVITSIDIAHRRKICELLLDKFPRVQFIVTTHEKPWAKTIEKLGVVKRDNVIEFQDWHVDTGPIRAEKGDVFARIDTELAKGSVNTAAPMLRQLLENRMRTHAHDLGALVVFREDNRYELGPLLTAVGARYTRLLEKAKKSAAKWGNTEQTARVEDLDAAWKAARKGYSVEEWAINVMTHFNPTLEVSPGEFAETVAATRALLAVFECDICNHPIVTEGYPNPTTLRCRCAKLNLNLVEK